MSIVYPVPLFSVFEELMAKAVADKFLIELQYMNANIKR